MFMKNIIPRSGFRRIAAIIVGSKYAAVMNDKANNVDNVQLLRNVRSIISGASTTVEGTRGG